MTKATVRLQRLLRLVTEIGRSKSGLRVTTLVERLGVSRPTVDRDLRLLRESGFPIERLTKVGEAWHRLVPGAFEGVTVEVITAITLARISLKSLQGTSHVAALDRAMGGYLESSLRSNVTLVPRGRAVPPEHIRALESAISNERRLRCRIWTSSSGDAPGEYVIEPARFVVVEQDVYVLAVKVDEAGEAWRRFKVVRFASSEDAGPATTEMVKSPPPVPGPESVKVWNEPTQRVVVRFAPNVSRVCREFPLVPDASFEERPDGLVDCVADVAGLVEVRPRLLAWGAMVEVLEPLELREWTAAELRRAADRYDSVQSRPTRETSAVSPRPAVAERTRGRSAHRS